MSQVKRIPYGISDFNQLRSDNCYLVDKTRYLPLIEQMPNYLFLIRPRRFGKSLFLSMMRTYYDIFSGTTLTSILAIYGLTRIPLKNAIVFRFFISIFPKPVVQA